MTFSKLIGGVVLLVVVVLWGILLFRSDDRPDVLRLMVGCYRHISGTRSEVIRVDSDGTFFANAFQTTVRGYQDKQGDALNPALKVVAVRGKTQWVEVESGNPLLLRTGADHQSLLIPGDNDIDTPFVRVACPA